MSVVTSSCSSAGMRIPRRGQCSQSWSAWCHRPWKIGLVTHRFLPLAFQRHTMKTFIMKLKFKEINCISNISYFHCICTVLCENWSRVLLELYCVYVPYTCWRILVPVILLWRCTEATSGSVHMQDILSRSRSDNVLEILCKMLANYCIMHGLWFSAFCFAVKLHVQALTAVSIAS